MYIKRTLSIALLTLGISCLATNSLSAQNISQQLEGETFSESRERQPTRILLVPYNNPKKGVGWEITTTSGEAEIQLAQHLVKIGAKEYVAWWCPHCHTQKQLFGKQAYQIINDNIKVECDYRGSDAKPELCNAAKIEYFPTWVINGKQYPGAQNLKDLARISGFQGDINFKYIR